MTSKFTQEVQKQFNLVSTKQNIFDNFLADLGKQDMSDVRPHDFLLVLQNAAECAEALDDLVRSHDNEQDANRKALSSLQAAHQQKGTAIRSKATSKASSIISDVSGFKDFAEQVEESITSVTKLSADSALSRTNHPVTGPSGFGSALSDAHKAKQELKKDAFNSYATMAGWSAGGATVLSWISGVSFMAGLGIGGFVAGGIFVLYGSKKSAGAAALRRLVSTAETELTTIVKGKLAEDAKARKEYDDGRGQENKRFNTVKRDLNEAINAIEAALVDSLSKFQSLSDIWKEKNAVLFVHSSNLVSSGPVEGDDSRPSTSYALLGMTSFSPQPKNTSASSRAHRDAASRQGKARPAANPSSPSNDHHTDEGFKRRVSDQPKDNSKPIEGQIYRGRVTDVMFLGALVDFCGSFNGFLHIDQITDQQLDHPSDVLEPYQEVWVEFVRIDEGGKYSLSMKSVNQDSGSPLNPDENIAGIRPKVDTHGQAEMLFDTAMEMFQDADSTQDGEKKREALLLLSSCVERFPEYVKAHCALGRALLFLNDTEEATRIVSQAYETAPDDPAVCSAYASCFVKKGSDLWDAGDMSEAFDAFMLSLKVNGFELQSFAASRHLAKETDQLSRWARECVELGIDPLKEVDVSGLGRT